MTDLYYPPEWLIEDFRVAAEVGKHFTELLDYSQDKQEGESQ